MAALQQRSQLRTPVAHELDAFKTYLEETCVTLSRAFAVLAPSKVPGPRRTLDCLPHCSHTVLATVAGATLAPVDALTRASPIMPAPDRSPPLSVQCDVASEAGATLESVPHLKPQQHIVKKDTVWACMRTSTRMLTLVLAPNPT